MPLRCGLIPRRFRGEPSLIGNRIERRLAAIVAADVAGYSRLMGVDEVGTARVLRGHRAVIDALVAKHGGRIVKTTGDGLLLEFPSVVDAIECGVALQDVMVERNKGVPQNQRMLLRIGINLGDILIDGEDILGDGVNVAARLESIAEPGGICISSSAYDQVRGKVAVEFTDLGEQTLKNINRPARVYGAKPKEYSGMVLPDVFHSHAQSRMPLPLPDKPSIAVLPFQNMSGDLEQEDFADGVVEDVITALSRFKSLFVIARNSSFAYKGKSPDIRQVGRDLGVKYVLEGSVRRDANRLRIAAQLIDTQSGAHVWADRFEGTPADVFEFQDEVTEKVVVAIAPRVERTEIGRALRRSSENLVSYDFFLRGLARYNQATLEGYEEALNLCNQAIALDPDFATAYGLAMGCYANRLTFGSAEESQEDKNKLIELWQTVARIGSDDSRALAAAGWAVAYMLRDLSSAKELTDRAVQLNPNLAYAWANSGWISMWLGHPELAVKQLSRAYRLDPVSDGIPIPMAHALFFLERYEEALNHAQQYLRRHPDGHSALRIGAASAAFGGRAKVARELADRLLKV